MNGWSSTRDRFAVPDTGKEYISNLKKCTLANAGRFAHNKDSK